MDSSINVVVFKYLYFLIKLPVAVAVEGIIRGKKNVGAVGNPQSVENLNTGTASVVFYFEKFNF